MALGAVIVILSLLVPQVRDEILRIYQFDAQSRRWRDPTTLTGRTLIWTTYLAAWQANPFFGAGPGGLAMTAGLSGHNAIIQYLGELGLVGTLPALMLILLAFVGSFRHRRDSRYFFLTACLIAAIVESSAESSLLNSGNPAGLMVLLSIAVLAVAKPVARSVVPADAPSSDYQAAFVTV
jgi:O-antigen ligase